MILKCTTYIHTGLHVKKTWERFRLRNSFEFFNIKMEFIAVCLTSHSLRADVFFAAAAAAADSFEECYLSQEFLC